MVLLKWNDSGGAKGGDMDRNGNEEAMNSILVKYEGIFQEPSGLPPIRQQDHAITVKEGCGPISVSPYRYAHNQKDEIECMVGEMLKLRVIQVSIARIRAQLY